MPYLLKVKIKKVTGGKYSKWYKEGEEHLVLPITTLSFSLERIPYFQKSKGFNGIRCDDCDILETVKVSKELYRLLNTPPNKRT